MSRRSVNKKTRVEFFSDVLYPLLMKKLFKNEERTESRPKYVELTDLTAHFPNADELASSSF